MCTAPLLHPLGLPEPPISWSSHSCAGLRLWSRAGLSGFPLPAGFAANTASLTVLGDDFTMINMVVENTVARPQQGVVGKQAVAFRSQGNRTLVYNCSIYSFQDTLYAQNYTQYYVDSKWGRRLPLAQGTHPLASGG